MLGYAGKARMVGLVASRRATKTKMRRLGGTLATTPDEITAVFAIHFTELYGREHEFDISMLDIMPQLPFADDMNPPYDNELHEASARLHIHHFCWRLWYSRRPKEALASTALGFAHIGHCVLELWVSDSGRASCMGDWSSQHPTKEG